MDAIVAPVTKIMPEIGTSPLLAPKLSPSQAATGVRTPPLRRPTPHRTRIDSFARVTGISDSFSVRLIGVPDSTVAEGEKTRSASGLSSRISKTKSSLRISSVVSFGSLKSCELATTSRMT